MQSRAVDLSLMLRPLTMGSQQGQIAEVLSLTYCAPVSVTNYRYDTDPVAASFGRHHKPMMGPGTRLRVSSEISEYCEVNNALFS